MEKIARTCAHLTRLGESLIADLTDADAARASAANGKTAGWLVGHLCVTGDFLRRKCGASPMTPKEWGVKFGPGTQPSTAAGDYPPITEMREAFAWIYADLPRLAPSLSADVLAAPCPFEPVRDRFPTLGDFLIWIMTGHLGYHLGQLSGWKAARKKH